MSTATLTQVASFLAEPLVRTGLYASPEQALKHSILDYIERQLAQAEANRAHYEQKYQRTFAEWSASLVGQATLAEEDDWMEWEATLDMVQGWQQVKAKVESGQPSQLC
jgi:hypothetical protein